MKQEKKGKRPPHSDLSWSANRFKCIHLKFVTIEGQDTYLNVRWLSVLILQSGSQCYGRFCLALVARPKKNTGFIGVLYNKEQKNVHAVNRIVPLCEFSVAFDQFFPFLVFSEN